MKSIKVNGEEEKIIKMAKNYRNDAQYYLEKIYLTSFGCITYAHGLLDAIRLTHDLIIEE